MSNLSFKANDFRHKAILTVRSPEFRSDFLYTGEFPHLVFTGEPAPKLVNKDLLKLASRYQLKTLKSLCRITHLKSTSDGQETNFKSR